MGIFGGSSKKTKLLEKLENLKSEETTISKELSDLELTHNNLKEVLKSYGDHQKYKDYVEMMKELAKAQSSYDESAPEDYYHHALNRYAGYYNGKITSKEEIARILEKIETIQIKKQNMEKDADVSKYASDYEKYINNFFAKQLKNDEHQNILQSIKNINEKLQKLENTRKK